MFIFLGLLNVFRGCIATIQYRVYPVVGVHVRIQSLRPDSGPALSAKAEAFMDWGGQARAKWSRLQKMSIDCRRLNSLASSGSLSRQLSPSPLFKGKCAMLQCILGYAGPQKDPSGAALEGHNPWIGT